MLVRGSKATAGASFASELEAALEAVSSDALGPSLGHLAAKLPVATGVELAAIRVREDGGEGNLHLLAIVGAAANERVMLFFARQSIAQARSLFALGPRHSLSRMHGLTWLHGEWLKAGDDVVGTLTVGCRTERRPTPAQLKLLRTLATRLGDKLAAVDRDSERIEAESRMAAQASVSGPSEVPARLASGLRPRELTILTLYADGLSAQEIAALFVISPHTVRTHIRNAYRRLGVHTKEEARQVIRAERVLNLV
jgi:DNA-binding CsgD family transcriptional regulator